MKRIAIMQPYFFPYIGYFQLISSADETIFLDDADFIKRGFINRNNIILNGSESRFTIPVENLSQNRGINEHNYLVDDNKNKKFLNSIYLNYKKSLYFKEIFQLINSFFENENLNVAQRNIKSIIEIFEYLEIKTNFLKSSDILPKGLFKKEKWILEICKLRQATNYINLPGGKNLYKYDFFRNNNIQLEFIKPGFTEYNQNSDKFIPKLSFIDIMMNNSKTEINHMLKNYSIEK